MALAGKVRSTERILAWVIAALTLPAYLGEGPTWILACAALRNGALVVLAAAGLREILTAGKLPRA